MHNDFQTMSAMLLCVCRLGCQRNPRLKTASWFSVRHLPRRLPMGVVLGMSESRELTQQVDCWPKQPPQVAYVSAGRKRRGAGDIAWGHTAKDITLASIACRRRSQFNRREKAIVDQTRIGTVSRATLMKLLRDGMESKWSFQSVQMTSWIWLNWWDMCVCVPLSHAVQGITVTSQFLLIVWAKTGMALRPFTSLTANRKTHFPPHDSTRTRERNRIRRSQSNPTSHELYWTWL